MGREHEVGMSRVRQGETPALSVASRIVVSWSITALRKAVSAMSLSFRIADCVEKDIAVQRIGFRSQ